MPLGLNTGGGGGMGQSTGKGVGIGMSQNPSGMAGQRQDPVALMQAIMRQRGMGAGSGMMPQAKRLGDGLGGVYQGPGGDFIFRSYLDKQARMQPRENGMAMRHASNATDRVLGMMQRLRRY